MQPYNLEVSWPADDYAAAAKALRACKTINPDNPGAVAEKICAMWSLLQKANPVIEEEAERRDRRLAPRWNGEEYFSEMHDIADAIADLTEKILKGAEAAEKRGGGR